MGDTTGGRKQERLLRHDRVMVANELRFALTSWSDRLIVLAVVLTVLVAVRSALSHRSFIIAAAAVAGFATAIGAAAARMIERRLDFHSQDGVLAADALTEDARRNYTLSIHALVAGLVTVCALIGRPNAAVFAPIGYLIGAGIAHIACRTVLSETSPRRPVLLRNIPRLLQRPISGAVVAIPVVLLLLLLTSSEPGQRATVIGVVSAVITLMLTTLDYHVVRFMTESGYSARRIISIHARSLAIFFITSVLASLILSVMLVSVVIVAVVLAALIFMTSRILAYRIFPKRTADTLVSICGIVCLAGVAMPMFLPVVVIAILWQLYRRAAPVTWLLK